MTIRARSMTRVAAVYLRVSTEDQRRKGYSLAEQREACRARAQALAGVDSPQVDILEFIDDLSGSFLDARDQLEAARVAVQRGQVDYFVCLHPDRFARDLFGQMIVYDELRKAGVKAEFVQVGFEDSPEGRLFFQMVGAISEYERAKIQERTQRGRMGKLKAGGIPNRVEPYGFLWNPDTDRPEPVAGELEWVRRMFQWAAGIDGDRLGAQQISDRLELLGAPTKRGGRWSRTTVRNILRNAAYAGRLVLNRYDFRGLQIWRRVPAQRRPVVRGSDGRERALTITPKVKPREEWFTVEVPVAVDPDLWRRVQALMNGAKRTSQPAARHLLSGLATCGACGARVRIIQGQRRYLRCQGRYPKEMGYADWDKRPPCTLPHLHAEPIEDSVWRVVRSWLVDPNELRRKAERPTATAGRAPERSRQEDAAEALRRQLAETKAAQGRILHLVENGKVHPEVAEQRLGPLQRQIGSLEHELRIVQDRLATFPRPGRIQKLGESAEALRAQVLAVIDNWDTARRRELLRRLGCRVRVFADGSFLVEPCAIVTGKRKHPYADSSPGTYTESSEQHPKPPRHRSPIRRCTRIPTPLPR